MFGGQLSGGTSLATVAGEILGTAEYQKRTVDIFFQDYLRRHADSSGSTFFTAFYAQGVVSGSDPDARIIAGLLASSEYNAEAQANTPILPIVPADQLAPSLP
jgi:hypothetical protein